MIEGPTTKICVGPNEVIFYIPQGLLAYYTTYFETAIEDNEEKTVHLPDESSELLSPLLQWMYQGQLQVWQTFKDELGVEEAVQPACNALCQLWFLAERLLIRGGIKAQIIRDLDMIIQAAQRIPIDMNILSQIFHRQPEDSGIRLCLLDRIGFDLFKYRHWDLSEYRELLEGPKAIPGCAELLVSRATEARDL